MPNIKDSYILDKSQVLKQKKYDFEEEYEKAKAEILALKAENTRLHKTLENQRIEEK